jgi:hypothetical protein
MYSMNLKSAFLLINVTGGSTREESQNYKSTLTTKTTISHNPHIRMDFGANDESYYEKLKHEL